MNRTLLNRKFQSDKKFKVIKRKNEEIERLKKEISDLKISCEEKNRLINSIESIYNDFLIVVDELREKRCEYEKMIDAINSSVFKGRWNLIKLFLK